MSSSIALRNTWFRLGNLLERSLDPLTILRVVNSVSPRSWKFGFSFDQGSRNVLRASANPPLSRADVESILDGSVPVVFACDEIRFEASTDGFAAAVGELRDQKSMSSTLPVSPHSADADARTLEFLGLFGRVIPSTLQTQHAIDDYLSEFTWLGSAPRAELTVTWSVLGRTFDFRPRDRLLQVVRKSPAHFCESVTLHHPVCGHMGDLRVAAASGLNSSTLYHRRYGRVEAPSPRMWRELRAPHDSWLLEIDDPGLLLADDDQLTPFQRLNELSSIVVAQIDRLRQTPRLQSYFEARDQLRREQSAWALRRRQEGATKAEMVYHRRRLLMAAPRAENETVALLCKLENLAALPLAEFKLVEYTAKRGIDSLAHVQVNSGDAKLLFAPVEIEYEFENFFDHGHYVGQVAMVVCWTFRTADDELSSTGVVTVRPGLYRYTEPDGVNGCWVVALSRIPGITVHTEGHTS